MSMTRRDFLAKSGRGLAALAAACSALRAEAPGRGMPDSLDGISRKDSGGSPSIRHPLGRGEKAEAPIVSGPELDAKIGQMIMAGFRGLALEKDNPIFADIVERKIGGVVLFDYDVPTRSPVRNVESPPQLRTLTAALRRTASSPLLIAIDQEGGSVARLKEKAGFPPAPSAHDLGARNDLAFTKKTAETTAAALAASGINLNFAPVVDLDVNPANPIIGGIGRSFSADPTIVTRHALEIIRAHHARGVLTALKHFPGHGSSKDDSHLGFVDVTDTWTERELEPYARIIAAKMCDSVMTAHVVDRRLDPDFPATLSRRIIEGILRERLRFDGVVFSDDMQMEAISANYGFDQAVRLAVLAGVDILTFANNSVFDPAAAGSAISAIKQGVRDGVIPTERIERSYRRISRLKARVGRA